MLRRIGTSIFTTFALTCSVIAQGYTGSDQCEVYVQVAFPNGTAVPVGTRIVVTGESTGVPMPLFTNRDGGARVHLRAGAYKVQVFSNDIETDSATATFQVYPGETSSNEYVTVRHKVNASDARPISATALQIPDNAREAFAKGMRDLHSSKNGSAKKHLQQAVKIFPRYGEALNVLGVLAMQEKDVATAEQLFRQAIAADPDITLPLINLSRIFLQRREYPAGEQLVNRAVQLDPRNPEALALQAYFALLQNHFDDAIAVANRVHGLEHKQYASVHFMAAKAYERKHRNDDAAGEYRLYLQEAPDGPSVAQAKSALNALQGLRASIR